MLSIQRHGAPFVVKNKTGVSSGARETSGIVKSISSVKNSRERINFVSCYSANGGHFSNAQMLANATGRPVMGYYEKVNKLTANLGTCGRTFRPQNKVSAVICSVGHQLLSGPVQAAIMGAEWLKSNLTNTG